MANAFVQSAAGDWTSGDSCAVSITATSGNLLAVSVHFYASVAGRAITGLGDGTNTYTPVDNAADTPGGVSVELATYYAKNITGGSLTITATFTDSNVIAARVVVHEISGADLTAPLGQNLDKIQPSPGSGTDGVTSDPVTTATAGEYVFGAMISANNATLTAGTGFTASPTASSLFATEYLIQGAAGSTAATFTTSTGDQPTFCAVMTFKAATGGGGGSTPARIIIQRA